MKIPTAAIIIIGSEILSGRTVDKNISYIAKGLNDLGIKLSHVHIIGDVNETIIQTVRQCHENFTYVFTTGGIGPTHDDITAEAIAIAFQRPLEIHREAEKILRSFYEPAHLTPARLKMALIPKGSTLIPNPVSAAPGFQTENVFVMAGVPDIMKAMFDEIASTLIPGPKIYSKTVQCLLGESSIAAELAAIQERYSEIEIGSYPYFKNKMYGLSLVLRGLQESQVLQATAEIMQLIKDKGGVPECS